MAQIQKKNRKYGRNQKWCQSYRQSGQQEMNKALQLLRAERDYPQGVDASFRRAFAALPELARRRAQRILKGEDE